MRPFRFPLLLLCLFSLSVALPATLFAQETTGTIIGTVTDDSGGVLPGVSVVIRHTGTGQTFERVTSSEGFYTAPLLPIGTYEATFTLPGFQQRIVRGIALSVNDRLQIDMKMSVGGVSEIVEVVSTQMVQPTAAVQTLVDSARVQELPINNRNFALLATSAPGVSSDLADEVGVGLTSTMNLSINGARRNAVNWLVDGVSNVDVGSNITLLSTPSLDSIEEFKIITSSYSAEWPRSGGGIINVVTKSGTSEFRATGYEFVRNDAFNANTYFRSLNTDPEIRDKAPYLRYNNFGYTLGGPLLPSRQKAFFFWSQEWRRIKRAPGSTTALVPNPEWLNDPTSANFVPVAERDANAVRLLQVWPAPNLAPTTPGGPGRLTVQTPNISNTRQEVVRVDYDLRDNWRLTARYTHDLSETRELGGLFFGTAVPNVATTDTSVPGSVAAVGIKTVIGGNRMNEFQYQFSSNNISTENPEGTRNRRSDFGVNIAEVFPENKTGLIQTVAVAGLSTIGANQLYRIQYLNSTVINNFSWQRGNHGLKFGGLASFEQKNENAASASQGSFSFAATAGGPSAFQSFLRGNATGGCPSCTYTESEKDIDVRLRFNRFELYAQDTWRARSNVTIDYGVRYSLFPPLTELDDLLATFDPALYNDASAPPFANTLGSLIDRTQGDLTVGIIRAGANSPYGRGIYKFKKDSIQPRIGVSWDPTADGTTIVRAAYGIYYDQPLVGIFEQNAFTAPGIVATASFVNPQLTNPASGVTPTTQALRTLTATATDFDNPRMMQWNVGMTRQLWMRAFVDIGYVGSRGDNLIRPIDINFPQPAAVVALQNSVPSAVNPARPYRSYTTINMRETTAKSRYHGLLTSFRYDAGRQGGTFTANYTLSRNRTDASNDRDAIDVPQNPLDLAAEYADARTDRRHIFNGSYIYELPFFRNASAWKQAIAGGWQIAGIVNISSGQPVPRVAVSTNNFRRGGFADLVGDIQAAERFDGDTPYWFNPDAFAPPADGQFGNSGRAPFRQPGRHQWDFTLSKNFYPTSDMRLQFRADFVNTFNQRQWLATPTADGLDNTCTVSITACNVAADRFGQLLATRAPREIQLGFRVMWR
jgi:hypothetical protein